MMDMKEMNEQERILEENGQLMVREVNDVRIASQADYEGAGRILVEIKTRIKQVKDYWGPLKKSASDAHKAVCARETEMLNPLTQAEKLLKQTMLTYQQEMERRRLAEEAEARRRQQEEAERLLSEAVKANEAGDEMEAEINLQMAQMVNEMNPVAAVTSAPKAQGTAIKKTWKARVINAEAVPAYVNGMEIRTIDLSALNRIAKMSSGKMTIPGIEFYEEASMAVRV